MVSNFFVQIQVDICSHFPLGNDINPIRGFIRHAGANKDDLILDMRPENITKNVLHLRKTGLPDSQEIKY